MISETFVKPKTINTTIYCLRLNLITERDLNHINEKLPSF